MAARRLIKLPYSQFRNALFGSPALTYSFNPMLTTSPKSITTSSTRPSISTPTPGDSQKIPASSIEQSSNDSGKLPTKGVLLTIDWILEGLTPQFMKARLQPIFEKMDQEVVFIDEIYGYKAKGISELGVHITKIRTYFRWKSPYNKVAHNGSYLFEDDNFIVVLWGLETINSNFWTYLPSFITGKENKPRIIEGALQFTVNPEGKIVKIVNRNITERDTEMAKEFGVLKKSENARFDREDRKAAEAEFKANLERQEMQ